MLDANSMPALPVFSFDFDGVRVDTFHCDADTGHPKHVHNYDHVTQVYSGRILVRTAEKEFEMTKHTKPVKFPADHWHELEALEDNTVFSNFFAVGKDQYEPITTRL